MNSGIKAFKEFRLIRYGIDTEMFRPTPTEDARKQWGFVDSERIKILVIAADFGIYRKGFDILIRTIDNFNLLNFEFLIAGKVNDRIEKANVSYLGVINDPAKLSTLYSAVDAVLLTSRSDNLPNVMIEALACGCPVLGFAVGGIKEIINPTNGLLAASSDENGLNGLLTKYLSVMNTFDRERIRNEAVLEFDSAVQCAEVTNFYKSLINNV
jgi:glycosyltransferase involved in cell wall biosynthesis